MYSFKLNSMVLFSMADSFLIAIRFLSDGREQGKHNSPEQDVKDQREEWKMAQSGKR